MTSYAKLLTRFALVAPVALFAGAAAQAGGYIPPVEEPVVAPIIETVTPGNWQGAYAGATLGYAFGGDDEVGLNSHRLETFDKYGTLKIGGANAGLHVGYRWQNGNWVFGPELGIEGGSIKDSVSVGGYDSESEVKNLIALRGKVGYAVQPDMLVYGSAGVARAKIDTKITGSGGVVGTVNLDESYNKTGYVVGLGVEKMLTERVSLTGEYEYANFGKTEVSEPPGGINTGSTPKFSNVKLGVNFKF